MLNLSELDLWVSSQLEPLRADLVEQGVKVAMLPKQAAAYSQDSKQGIISIAIPQVTGETPGDRGIGQKLIYEINVLLRMPQRYQDTPEEKQAVEYLADTVCELLVRKYPLGDEDTVTPIWLLSYELLRPDGNQWTASLTFQFKRSTTAKFENYNPDTSQVAGVLVEFLTRGEEPPTEAVEFSIFAPNVESN